MAAVTRLSSWVSYQWKRGWTQIPIVMACHCVTTPMFIATMIYKWVERDTEIPAEKYRMTYTVVRPGDPRIARINHESRLDVTGFLPPAPPCWQYPMSK